MIHQATLETRLAAYHKREAYIWICVRGDPRVSFGWVIGCKDEYVQFKDDEFRFPMRIPVGEIESCGAV